MSAAAVRSRRADPAVLLATVIPAIATFGLAAPPVVLDDIRDEFDISFAVATWVLIVYTLALGLATPAAGKLADVRGTRWLLGVGGGLLCSGSAIVLVGDGFSVVLVGRALQGAGAGAASTAAFTVLSRRTLGAARARQLGVLTAGSSIVFGVGALAGALVGGLGWAAVLALPLLPGVIALAAVLLPGTRGQDGVRFDPRGALLVTAVAAGALVTLQGTSSGLSVVAFLIVAATTAVAWTLLVRHGRAEPDGFVPRAVLADAGMRRRLIAAALLSAWSLATAALAPQLIADVHPTWTTTQAGLALLPVAAVSGIVAIASSHWPPQRPVEPVLALLGVVSVAAGLTASLIGGAVGPSLAMASGTSAFAGTQVTVLAQLPETVPAEDLGISIATLSTAVILGGAAGAAIASVVLELVGPTWCLAVLAILPGAAVAVAMKRGRPLPAVGEIRPGGCGSP